MTRQRFIRALVGSRYHSVFVSSTYLDLRNERRSLFQPLLAKRFLPIGMEFWPASVGDIEGTIRQYLLESDYYVLILKDSYGTIAPADGRSYTHMEYDLAVALQVPQVVVQCVFPDSSRDAAVDAFLAIIKKSGQGIAVVKSPADLPAAVQDGLLRLRDDFPRVGMTRTQPSPVGFALLAGLMSCATYVIAFIAVMVFHIRDNRLDIEAWAGMCFFLLSGPVYALSGCLYGVIHGAPRRFSWSLRIAAKIATFGWIVGGMVAVVLAIAFLGEDFGRRRLFDALPLIVGYLPWAIVGCCLGIIASRSLRVRLFVRGIISDAPG